MERRRGRLARKFQDQEKFARDYSPLYAQLFGLVGGWLADPNAANDPLVRWLIQASQERRNLDVTLLLAAGLHYEILARHTTTAELAEYFPTAGGGKSPTRRAFGNILRRAILASQNSLATFIQQNSVQTNETGRGLCWLLPVLTTGWPGVHLIDLGASAGLNLVADLRSYRLEGVEKGREILNLGKGRPVQFRTRCRGIRTPLSFLQFNRHPTILSRLGNDLSPFALATGLDELLLMSFIWGDQVDRLTRLQEGIAAFHQVQTTDAAVRLVQAALPKELATFLEKHGPQQSDEPVVIYNTWMSAYLEDKGDCFPEIIGRWARSIDRPLLWLQWEPPRNSNRPPEYGWCAWTADLWSMGQHQRWHLGWVHPHGGIVEFEEGHENWLAFWS